MYHNGRDRIGTIDDLIVGLTSPTPYLIHSVGGGSGLTAHRVAVPFSSIQIVDKELRLPDATHESMKALPELKYASD
ncbi:hypothetical protein [Paraburkholderia pallida]|uniref:hypothetical protein n=1 Tax=Paraburkholderia pallida TaxID=2547399 RepID=UPI001E32D37C|nr:hypothetical protein [Paraburkholderia pallida]